jgi:hypothetical protein
MDLTCLSTVKLKNDLIFVMIKSVLVIQTIFDRSGSDFWKRPDPDPVPDPDLSKFLTMFILEFFFKFALQSIFMKQKVMQQRFQVL